MAPRWKVWLRLTRPFTLLPPLIGMLSGAATALGAMAHRRGVGLAEVVRDFGVADFWLYLGLGALLAAALNAGSNVLNQWTDLENDRINKPHRPLPAGDASLREALVLLLIFYAAAFLFAALIRPEGRWHTFWIVLAGAVATIVYSVPPFRTKRFGTWANLTIASARGCLLKVCGWSCLAPAFPDPEPWFIGGVFAFFLTGAASTKDFADIEGDRAAGCITWPIRYGPAKAARFMAPFFVLPWLLIPVGCFWPLSSRDVLLTGDRGLLIGVSLTLAVYGVYVARLILRDPDALTTTENHPSWRHMYLQMMLAQLGLMAAYLI